MFNFVFLKLQGLICYSVKLQGLSCHFLKQQDLICYTLNDRVQNVIFPNINNRSSPYQGRNFHQRAHFHAHDCRQHPIQCEGQYG